MGGRSPQVAAVITAVITPSTVTGRIATLLAPAARIQACVLEGVRSSGGSPGGNVLRTTRDWVTASTKGPLRRVRRCALKRGKSGRSGREAAATRSTA